MKKLLIAVSFISLSGLFLTGCQSVNTAHKIAHAAVLPQNTASVEWKKVLPPPPANYPEIEQVIAAQGEKSGKRWEQAQFDNSHEPFAMYQQVLGDGFTAKNNPELAAALTYAAKAQIKHSREAKLTYTRTRPFQFDKKVEFCVKGDEPSGSSYPSGHTSWGWLSAQIIARAYPTRADDILQRGREYGESRVICGAHYPSDITGGRIVADTILQRLDSEKEFRGLMAKIKPQ